MRQWKGQKDMNKNCSLDSLVCINRNANGDYYFIYSVKARRSINAKAKRTADELLIVGVPQKRLISYLKASLKGERKDGNN